MECTDKEWEHCRVEKLGCEGCYYYKKEEKINEQKISKCASDKSDKTN